MRVCGGGACVWGGVRARGRVCVFTNYTTVHWRQHNTNNNKKASEVSNNVLKMRKYKS